MHKNHTYIFVMLYELNEQNLKDHLIVLCRWYEK